MFSTPSASWQRTSSLLILTLAAAGLQTRGREVRAASALRVDVLRPVSAIPPAIVGEFENPVAFQRAANGQYFVFDHGAHTVYGVDAKRTAAWRLLQVGQETGRVIEPIAFDVAPNGTFAVADSPRGTERVQIFGPGGNVLGGFTLPGRLGARVAFGGRVLNGAGSLRYTGSSLLMSHPESGALFTEYLPSGTPVRSIGRLRATGHESDRDLHVAMNAGLPLVDPAGGFYFVFLAGTPLFQKYDARGTLVFERHIEGRELDDHLRLRPQRWPTRKVEDREVPFVMPSIRAAAVDPGGQLWISLAEPFTYVYDTHGDKMRTVQFRGAGIISPTSFFFTDGGSLLVTPGCYEFSPVDAPRSRP